MQRVGSGSTAFMPRSTPGRIDIEQRHSVARTILDIHNGVILASRGGAITYAPRRVPELGTRGRREAEPSARDTRRMVDDNARELAIYHALKAVDEVAAALQAHLLEEHKADLERAAAQSTFTNSLKLLRQARERLGEGLRAVEADHIAASDDISLRNEHYTRATDV
jgi:hypothetical protein